MYEKFCFETYGPGIHVDPYIMALPFLCVEIDRYLSKPELNSHGLLIFDEQKQYLSHVERSLRLLRLDQESVLKTTKIIEKGFFVESNKSFALQLIDLAACYLRKFEESELGLRVSEIDRQTFPMIRKMVVGKDNARMKDIFEWVRKNHLKQK